MPAPTEAVEDSAPAETPRKIKVISDDRTETDKMEDENNKLDAEIEELEKMFRDQI